MKRIVSLIAASVAGGFIALGVFIFMEKNDSGLLVNKDNQLLPAVQTNFTMPNAAVAAENTDFTLAAEQTVNAVVHVKNVAVTSSNPILEYFYGEGAGGGRARIGTGSGVIISPDGYIVTNNHVIRGAQELEVTLNNNKTYKANVVGAHESSDIALLKIDADDLPYITFANSDNIKVGEWVLAVGNPFNLTSTVTAGIVSAKGRDINISNGTRMIESFIQTDAAVNPGNSGGALVNTRGELVGINTAISSQTGSYVGYSFAVPSNIAKKVVEDIMEFGDVQTAYLGIQMSEINGELANELNLDTPEGVLIANVLDDGAAKQAGLEKNDIITDIDNHKITKFADLQGFLSTKRPGDKVNVTVLRNGHEKKFEVKLANQFGKESIDKSDFSKYYIGEMKKIPTAKATKYRIDYGLEISKLKNTGLSDMGINNGDLLIRIDDEKIYSVDDVERILRQNKNKTVVLGIVNNQGYGEYALNVQG